MGWFDGLKDLASQGISNALGNVLGNAADGFNLSDGLSGLPAVIGEHFNAEQLGEIARVAGDHLNMDQINDLSALAQENISVDQIGSVAGMIREQGAGLDPSALAERAGLPSTAIDRIVDLLGR